MKYHLRNNIIEILFKKNNINEVFQDKYTHHMTKSQKLINKPNNSHRLREENISKTEINKTFR